MLSALSVYPYMALSIAYCPNSPYNDSDILWASVQVQTRKLDSRDLAGH